MEIDKPKPQPNMDFSALRNIFGQLPGKPKNASVGEEPFDIIAAYKGRRPAHEIQNEIMQLESDGWLRTRFAPIFETPECAFKGHDESFVDLERKDPTDDK